MKIALLGYGVETESAYNYYKKTYPWAKFISYDDKPEPKKDLPQDVEFIGNYHDFHNIDADIIVRTPAIAPSRVSSKGIITSVTKEFFAKCQAPIIGVTGTKGKGTTCTLIAEMLKAADKKVWLVGNIGAPALDFLNQIQKDDIVIYELSSFQLWDLDKSPHIAVVLMIEPEHLEVHENVDDYLNAKLNITLHQHQNDIVIFHPTNQYSYVIASRSPASSKKKYLSPQAAFIKDKTVVIDEHRICSINDIRLVGNHNIENVCAAVTVAWEYTKNVSAIKKTLVNFKGLMHRLQFVREVDGVRYYDDSYGTTPSSSIAAIKAFKAPKILILGGSDKGATYEDLASVIKQSNVRKVILIGNSTNPRFKATAPIIENELKTKGIENIISLIRPAGPSVSEIIRTSHDVAHDGDVVLLSTACASFDMFKSVTDRGNQFIEAVKAL